MSQPRRKRNSPQSMNYRNRRALYSVCRRRAETGRYERKRRTQKQTQEQFPDTWCLYLARKSEISSSSHLLEHTVQYPSIKLFRTNNFDQLAADLPQNSRKGIAGQCVSFRSLPGDASTDKVVAVPIKLSDESIIAATALAARIKGFTAVQNYCGFASSSTPSELLDLLDGLTRHPNNRKQLMSELLEYLDLSTDPDEILLMTVEKLKVVGRGWTHYMLVLFSETWLLPKISRLKTPASRTLLRALSVFAVEYPEAIMGGILTPLLGTPSKIRGPQSEVISRLIRDDLSKENVLTLLHDLVSPSGSPFDYLNRLVTLLNDNRISIVQAIIQSSPQSVEEKYFFALIESLDLAMDDPAVRKSVKFSSLLLQIISKFKSQCRSEAPRLVQIATKCESFMAKSIVRKLENFRG